MRVGGYEFQAVRYSLNPASFLLLVSYATNHPVPGVSIGTYFAALNEVLVDEHRVEDFEEVCKYLHINLYTQRQLERLTEALAARQDHGG